MIQNWVKWWKVVALLVLLAFLELWQIFQISSHLSMEESCMVGPGYESTTSAME